MDEHVFRMIQGLQEELDAARACLKEVLDLLVPDPCTDGQGIFADIPPQTVTKWMRAAGVNVGEEPRAS